jgi:AcrR family transcriptional regulator
VADICGAAGIGRRTFSRYFATKDDVLTEPAREMTARVVAAVTSAPADMSEPQVLRHALTEIAILDISGSSGAAAWEA